MLFPNGLESKPAEISVSEGRQVIRTHVRAVIRKLVAWRSETHDRPQRC